MSESDFKLDYLKKDLPQYVRNTGFILTLAGLVIVIISYIVDPVRTANNSLIMTAFVVSIGVCSLFLVALEYLAGAVWSVVFRRISEFLSTVIFIAPFIAIPFLINLHSVFQWTHAGTVAKDVVLAGKSPYLNINFFLIRFAFLFIIWGLFYFVFIRNSQKQDITHDQKLTKRNIVLSGIFMPVFGITISIAGIDWLMSLEPKWFSTIFGVYYFSGGLLAALAALTLIAVRMNEKGLLIPGIRKDHFYSLGALLFAFTNFWAYIAFSQYMLIWYANLPEETFWFISRSQGNWLYITIGIAFARFVIPYIMLLTQPSKMNPKRLKIVSIWILLSHWYDLYWMVMPKYSSGSIVFSWYEFAFPIFGLGLIMLIFYFRAKLVNAIPIGDPKLQRSLEFRL
jgi:hypothetical protein